MPPSKSNTKPSNTILGFFPIFSSSSMINMNKSQQPVDSSLRKPAPNSDQSSNSNFNSNNNKRDNSTPTLSSDVARKMKQQRLDESSSQSQNTNMVKHQGLVESSRQSEKTSLVRIVEEALQESEPRQAASVVTGYGAPSHDELRLMNIKNRRELLLKMQDKKGNAVHLHGQMKHCYQVASCTCKSHPSYESLKRQYNNIGDIHLNNYGGLLVLCEALEQQYGEDDEIKKFAAGLISKIKKIMLQLVNGSYAYHSKF